MARYGNSHIGPVRADFHTDFTDAVAMEAAAVTTRFRRRFQEAPARVNVVYIGWNHGIDTGQLSQNGFRRLLAVGDTFDDRCSLAVMAVADDRQPVDGTGRSITDFPFDATGCQDDVIPLKFIERGNRLADDEVDAHLFNKGHIAVDSFRRNLAFLFT